MILTKKKRKKHLNISTRPSITRKYTSMIIFFCFFYLRIFTSKLMIIKSLITLFFSTFYVYLFYALFQINNNSI